jgi:hypothetical protein
MFVVLEAGAASGVAMNIGGYGSSLSRGRQVKTVIAKP